MHQFLRAIGFSDITKKQLNEVINNIIDKPEKLNHLFFMKGKN